jgi:hypothetical protein
MGGEPLLRFDLLQKIVPYGKLRARQRGKSIHFGCTTNCTILTDEALAFWRRFGMGFHCSMLGEFFSWAQSIGDELTRPQAMESELNKTSQVQIRQNAVLAARCDRPGFRVNRSGFGRRAAPALLAAKAGNSRIFGLWIRVARLDKFLLHMQHKVVRYYTQLCVCSCQLALWRTSTRRPEVNDGDASKYLTLVRS